MDPDFEQDTPAPAWGDAMRAGLRLFASRWRVFTALAVLAAAVMAVGPLAHMAITRAELTGTPDPAEGPLALRMATYLVAHAAGWSLLWGVASGIALEAAGSPRSAHASARGHRLRTMLAAGTLVAVGELACGLGAAVVLTFTGMVGFTSALGCRHPWRAAAHARDEFPVTVGTLALAGTLAALGAAGLGFAAIAGVAGAGRIGFVLAQFAFVPVLVVFTCVLCCWAAVFVRTPIARDPHTDGEEW
ncbi:MAG: hypothetical protein IT198_09220 [Acidimicrobiia bacterium]|nr:hypothetical protein [Acidimicrobiia bacterium]